MQRYSFLGMLAAIATFLTSLSGTYAHAAPASVPRCFPETSYCIDGAIRAYWEQQGGLAVFGYPISPPLMESVEGRLLPVQWFQRDRLEDHGSAGILAGRLGAQLLELQGDPWQTLLPADPPIPGCRFFTETRQNLCDPFLSYWNRQGGLARFGYPISTQFEDTIGSWRGPVQFFERRRMEYHAEYGGAILLGLLGQSVYEIQALQKCGIPVERHWIEALARSSSPSSLGCPHVLIQEAPGLYQNFDHGKMVWVDLGSYGRTIYVMFDPPAGSLVGTYQVFADPGAAQRPAPETPPAGRYPPDPAFAGILQANADIREQLGWAQLPAAYPDHVDYLLGSQDGLMLLLRDRSDFPRFTSIDFLTPDGRYEALGPWL